MTNLTSILANESGIQYQGVLDASSSTGTYPVIGLIVGKFRGGRTDKPMTITNANIKTMLGFDPNNPHYLAVQDVLDTGVPSVQVLRVAGESEEKPELIPYPPEPKPEPKPEPEQVPELEPIPDPEPQPQPVGFGLNPLQPIPLGTPLVSALEALTIEAFYIEDQYVPLLQPEYQNLNGMSGHICNRSQFGVHMNNMRVGYVNMNNDITGERFPNNNDNNLPKAISLTNTWTGDSNKLASRYSRVDISREQAEDIASNATNSILEFFLGRLMTDVHTDVTWVRFSVRMSDGKLYKLIDRVITLGRYYTFDMLNPQNGILERNQALNPTEGAVLYVDQVWAKWGNREDYLLLPTTIEVNPDLENRINFDLRFVPWELNGAVPLEFELVGSYSDLYMDGADLILTAGSYYNNRKIAIDVKIGTGVTQITYTIQFGLTTLDIDLNASVMFRENGTWKTLETGTTIPDNSLRFLVNVDEIVFNDKVTAIGKDCVLVSNDSEYELTRIKFSANLKTIGENSFRSMVQMPEIILPEGLESIGRYTFTYMGRYRDPARCTLSIPKSLTVIPDKAFEYWYTPTLIVNLRDTGIVTIGNAFYQLERVNYMPYTILLPDTLKSVNGFRRALIGKILFGRSIETIHPDAFGEAFGIDGSRTPIAEIIILRSDAMVEPMGDTPFGGLPFHENRKLAVPFDLVAEYQASTQWAKLVSSANITGIDPDTYD